MIFCVMSRSVSSELSRRQIEKFVCEVGIVRVIAMALWSERSMGSMVAVVRSVKSFCEMKK